MGQLGEKLAAHLTRQINQNSRYLKAKYGWHLDIDRPKGGFYQTGDLKLKCSNCGRTIEMKITSYYKNKPIKCYSCNHENMRII